MKVCFVQSCSFVYWFFLFNLCFCICKVLIVFLAAIAPLTWAIPLPQNDYHKEPVKRGLFDSLSHFPFLASSSSAHGSSASSSSSSSDHDHDFHSHVIHHPELDGHHHDDFFHDDNVAISYQNQYFGHDHHDYELPTSYHQQHLFDDHFGDFNKYDGLHDSVLESSHSLLESSHLDAPNYIDDYKNYGGDLGLYSHNAGYLDISDDHKIDNLLDPFSPSHSSYDSYWDA